MKVISPTQELKEPVVATIGFFDGVHCGHQFLLKAMHDEAQRRGYKSLVVTFVNSPRCFLNGEHDRLLTTPSEKELLLSSYTAVDYLLELPFDDSLSKQSSEQFLGMLHECYSVQMLYVGFNNSFGGDTANGFEHYVEVGKRLGVEVKQMPSLPKDGVSSTAIRMALSEGDIAHAGVMLGHDYLILGKVVSGNQIGRKIGFPTANIEVTSEKVLPRDGVYVGATLMDGVNYRCVVNIGSRPTIGGQNRTVEVHLIGFEGNLYGKALEVYIVSRLRDEHTFSSLEELKEQIARDVAMVKG